MEQSLTDLPGVAVPFAREELLRLNAAAEAWRPGESEPPWAMKAVPESDTRINLGLYNFPDLDGTKPLFSLHVRYNPRPGRIHFRLVTEEGKIRVGYVGRKQLADGIPRKPR